MNYCKKCGEPCPDGKDLYWSCSHDGGMGKKYYEEDTECETCRVPSAAAPVSPSEQS